MLISHPWGNYFSKQDAKVILRHKLEIQGGSSLKLIWTFYLKQMEYSTIINQDWFILGSLGDI